MGEDVCVRDWSAIDPRKDELDEGETDLPGGVKPGEGRKCYGTHLDEPEVQAAFRPKEPPPKASSKGKGKVPETLEQVLSRQYKDYHERMKRHGKMSKEEQEADDERREKAAEDQWKEYETIIEESNAPFGDNWFRGGCTSVRACTSSCMGWRGVRTRMAAWRSCLRG